MSPPWKPQELALLHNIQSGFMGQKDPIHNTTDCLNALLHNIQSGFMGQKDPVHNTIVSMPYLTTYRVGLRDRRTPYITQLIVSMYCPIVTVQWVMVGVHTMHSLWQVHQPHQHNWDHLEGVTVSFWPGKNYTSTQICVHEGTLFREHFWI
jgi:hypothetical protein